MQEERTISVNDFEHRLMVKSLSEFRNDLIRKEMPTEDVDDLLIKVIDAPARTGKRRVDRDER